MPLTQQQHILDQLKAMKTRFLEARVYGSCVATLTQAHDLISRIHKTLDGKEWDSDTAQAIADQLRDYGLDVRDPSDEAGMTAIELAEKYAAPDGSWGEHPRFSRRDWREEVSVENTQRGYWDWVVAQIEQENDQ